MTIIDDQIPSSLSPRGRDRWLHGSVGSPAVGDLWLLSWDTQVALALITVVRETYVRVWPVTVYETVSPANVAILEPEQTPLHTPLILWIGAESAAGNHLLLRRLGSVLTKDEVKSITVDLDSGGASKVRELTVVHKGDETDEARSFEHNVLGTFRSLAMHEWPGLAPGEATIDSDFLKSYLEKDPEWLADAIDSTHYGHVLALWSGTQPATVEEVQHVARAAGVSPEEVLKPISSPEADVIREPEFKADVLDIGRRYSVSEGRARSMILERAGQAARQAKGRDDVLSRVRSAIESLEAEGTS